MLAASENMQERNFSVPLVSDEGQVITRYAAPALYFAQDLSPARFKTGSPVVYIAFLHGSAEPPSPCHDREYKDFISLRGET
jgi:hypothetical protein